jgi:hypothetical protein
MAPRTDVRKNPGGLAMMASMSSSFTKIAFGFLFTLVLFGCAATQRVTYSVESVPRAKDSNIAHVKLTISPLVDNRRNTPGNEVLFSSANETTIDGNSYCVNAETGYDPNSVAIQISEMLALHLRKRGVLRAVSAGHPVADAYYLSGTLHRYYGAQKSTSVSPATGVLFGAVGAAIAAAATPERTPGTISIEIVDLALHDGSGKTIAKLGDIKYTKKLELPAATDCVVVYNNVNEHLKQVFGELAHSIEDAIANAVRDTQPEAVVSAKQVAQPAAAVHTQPVARPAAAANADPLEKPAAAGTVGRDPQPPAEPW